MHREVVYVTPNEMTEKDLLHVVSYRLMFHKEEQVAQDLALLLVYHNPVHAKDNWFMCLVFLFQD